MLVWGQCHFKKDYVTWQFVFYTNAYFYAIYHLDVL